MRICIRKSTNRIIEMQSKDGSGTSADLDVLKTNAINAGIPADDLECRFVTEPEYLALLVLQQPTKTESALSVVNSIDRLQFDVLLNHENRIRTLESRPTLTANQLKDFLVARWEQVN